MRTRHTLISITVLLTAIVFWILYVSVGQNNPKQDDYIQQAILQEFPSLISDGNPVIKIESIKDYTADWYVAKIRSNNQTRDGIPVYIILHGTGNTIQVILGPEAYFTESQMLQYNLPDSVMKELL